MSRVLVLKKDISGAVTWQYQGTILRRQPSLVVVEAFFDRDDMQFMDVRLKRGDRFVETFFTNRWYNIFAIFDKDSGRLKGYYCNICVPAELKEGTVSYIDLALDLWVGVNGEQTVLDWHEFEALGLDNEIKKQALGGLTELQTIMKNDKLLQ